MKNMINIVRKSFLLCLAAGICLTACETRQEPSSEDTQEVVHYAVAVVLPLDNSNRKLWNRIADQVDEKLVASQRGLSKRVALDLEWYDENNENLVSLSKELADRKDVVAVIGAYTSDDTKALATSLVKVRKPLISPTATSVELARLYAGKQSYWALSETDVTQCELLLHIAQDEYRDSEVSLIAPNSVYGQSFLDWFGFLAKEIGMKVGGVYSYDADGTGTEKVAATAFSSTDGMVIAVPNSMDDVRVIARAHRDAVVRKTGKDVSAETMASTAPHLLFSDMAYSPELLELPAEEIEMLSGTSIASNPESGFDSDYQLRYYEDPSGSEALLHDAFVLVALGLREVTDGLAESLNDAMKDVVRTKDSDGRALPKIICFDDGNLSKVMRGLSDGSKRYDISGASCNLDFDEEQYTSVLHSIYREWVVYNGRFIDVSYISSDGSGRTENTLAAWKQKTTYDEDFRTSVSFSYPEINDRWALLIAGSTGWENYRHQADVLYVYRMLRNNGYPDDHIVLILADDIASSEMNPAKGYVFDINGKDLYAGAEIDYRLAELMPDDVAEILAGRSSDRLPEVIKAGSNDNILVFWSGHGQPGGLCWDKNLLSDTFTTARMSELLRTMSAAGCYRKMLWLIETCYSGSVAKAAETLNAPHVMMITAANADETSKADVFNEEFDVWMSNRFTQNLISTIEEDASCKYIELFRGLTRQTTGSHVSVYNNRNFDNLYLSSIEEFFKYQCL